MQNTSDYEDPTVSVESVLNTYFEDSIENATNIDPSYRLLWEEIYALIRSGGKKLRPRMTMMSYTAYGGSDKSRVVPVAAAQELLHFSLLIHDDIIDRDYTRYGTLNVAGRYKKTYSKYLSDEGEITHFANSAAILAGDLMLAGAHELIVGSSLNQEEKMYAHRMLARSIFDVAGGELLDTESSFIPRKKGDTIKIAKFKTASYSFSAPLLLGSKLAGASQEELTKVNDFAIELGIAYQLVDDLLGVFGEEDETGKSSTSDITEGKHTYMVETALETMTPSERSEFDAVFGDQEASADGIDMIKQLLISTGAKAHTEDKIREYSSKASDIMNTFDLSDDNKQYFEQLINKVTKRVA